MTVIFGEPRSNGIDTGTPVTEARGDAQGQSGAGTQARGDSAPDVGGWHPVRRCQGRRGGITEGGINRFGRPVRVVRSRVPSPGRWIRSGRITCSGAVLAI